MQVNPLKIPDIRDLTDDDLDKHLEDVRERRLKPVHIYEQMLKMKSEARRIQLGETLEKQLEMFEKELERVNKAIEKLEGRSRKLRSIRMEIEIS
jgi:RecG-like helicase